MPKAFFEEKKSIFGKGLETGDYQGEGFTMRNLLLHTSAELRLKCISAKCESLGKLGRRKKSSAKQSHLGFGLLEY